MKKSAMICGVLTLSLLSLSACSSNIEKKIDKVERNVGRLATEAEADREYIKTVAESAKSVAESMTVLKDLGSEAMKIAKVFLIQLSEKKEPAKTPDLDDLPGGDGEGNVANLPSSNSGPLTIHEAQCVRKPAGRVHDVVTGYSQYSKLDDGIAYVDTGFSRMKLIDMVKSQPISYAQLRDMAAKKGVTLNLTSDASNPKDTDFVVWVVMQPMNLTDGALYPRFALDCRSRWAENGSFRHECRTTDLLYRVDRKFTQYALKRFQSTLTTVVNAPDCRGGTKLDYTVVLESNSAHVQSIKQAVLGAFSFLGPLVDGFFNEDQFFRNYYAEFYQAWVKAL